MGDELTPSVSPAAVLRAKFLKAALKRGTAPALLHTIADTEIAHHSWLEDSPELQRAHLQQLVENAPEAITVLDSSLRVVRVNAEFARMFGYSAEEALGRSIQSLIVPPDLWEESSRIAKELRLTNKVSLETRRRRKDGSQVDVSILGSALRVAGDSFVFYGIYRDISDQKHAEALNSALYRIAEQTSAAEDLQQFFRSVHGIVGELMYARNFYIALLDPDTQLLTFPYFVDEEDAPPVPRNLQRGLTEYVMRTREPLLASPEVFRNLVASGEVNEIGAPSVDWLGVPLRAGNAIIGAVVVQSYTDKIRFGNKEKDILTFVSQQLASAIEHKRNEEALRRSEARYRSLVESAAYGIYRCRLDGRFIDVNSAVVTMLGYRSVLDILALDPTSQVFVDSQEYERFVRQCTAQGRLDNFEARWKRADQGVITVRLSGRAVITDTDRLLEVIAEDITERRALEDQFRQAQKMEAVGRLAGGVAHDFNNLLMVVSGYSEVLLSSLPAESPLRAKAESIQQAADRATTLTRQLLAFSRKQLLELKIVDVNAVVSDMERLLRPLIGENIELVTRLGAGLGRTRADAGQLEQVLMNLVVNSKDAMPNGGKIIIQTSNTDIDESYRREHTYMQPGSYVLLSVSDTGCGMDKETQSRVFEPFFTTKEKGKGTGLGLSTVYGIVKQSGGYILAQSEPGHGTTFRIYLPRVDGPQETIRKDAAKWSDLRGSETILLAEDEDSVRQLVRETLELRGYHVIEAENGEEALRLASNGHSIQLLMTDVVMPGMGGKELAREVRRLHPQMQVLFLSGHAEEAIITEGTEPGTAFLQKPFTLQSLARKVREVLQSH